MKLIAASAAVFLAAGLALAGCAGAVTHPSGGAKTHSSASSAPVPAATPQLTAGADGACSTDAASWSPMLSADGIKVQTYATGHVNVSVVTSAGTVTKSATIGPTQTPYSIEVPTVKPSDVKTVTLGAIDAPTSQCLVLREPGS